MRPDLGALFHQNDGDVLAALGRELLQPDRGRKARGARAHDHDIILHPLTLDAHPTSGSVSRLCAEAAGALVSLR